MATVRVLSLGTPKWPDRLVCSSRSIRAKRTKETPASIHLCPFVDLWVDRSRLRSPVIESLSELILSLRSPRRHLSTISWETAKPGREGGSGICCQLGTPLMLSITAPEPTSDFSLRGRGERSQWAQSRLLQAVRDLKRAQGNFCFLLRGSRDAWQETLLTCVQGALIPLAAPPKRGGWWVGAAGLVSHLPSFWGQCWGRGTLCKELLGGIGRTEPPLLTAQP